MLSKDELIGLAHIGLFCSDIEKTKLFYNKILGFKVIHENLVVIDEGEIKVAFIALHDLTIEIVELPIFDAKRADGLFDHIAFRVKNIESVVGRLKQADIQFEEDIYFAEHFWESGAKWIMFRGPDNERLELTEIM